MSIGNLESFLEKKIEGFFNRKLSSVLEPTEVIKQLEREIIRKRRKSQTGLIVPNFYYVEMAPDDYQRLCARRFLDELYVMVEKMIISNDCFMDGQLEITLNANEEFKKGTCEVKGTFVDDSYGEMEQPIEVPECHTIVLNKSEFKPPLNLPVEHKTVSLLAIEGPDIDSYLEFGEKQIYIGRRVNNDFILTDTNASRVHAFITYERHRHILYDAESLNGTFVNGQRVVSPQLLHTGDEIRIGETVLVYEVI
ncbi:FhaA domain-containing protein [Anaerovibrio lipolyticus]|uniref:FhaA domain-containing protein n=1 Tax=Anaerovibrio lipolyticus TaxID=82374 RepID=UPI0026EBD7B5|nr:FhaA domain-containing protein [Anaerovibrio lipolyticus]MBE6106782.1 DUF2662 domain-containing protein [Anaerovibrio lipolyticus]